MFNKIKSLFSSKSSAPRVIGVDQLPTAAAGNYDAPFQFAQLNGDKFIGGYGDTQLLQIDYWTMRHRSKQLYQENLYAQGLINRFITNTINTGLTLEAKPVAGILGIDQETLNQWTDDVEARFSMYCNNPKMVDFYGEKTLAQLQTQRELQALVEGDVLVVYHFDNQTKMPKVQLISSDCVQSPLETKSLAKGHRIEHGVEFDKEGREVGYHVLKDDGKFAYFPCVGERSGRVVANLYRPGKRLMGQVRGMPLIGNVLQSLREIDRYRDSTQRKALVASFLALAVERDLENVASGTLGAAASRVTEVASTDGKKKVTMREFGPGMVVEGLAAGEKIKQMGSQGTDLSFGDFEAAIINAVAWSKGMPPEILKMAFGSNYAASKQATAEFNMFLDTERANTTTTNDKPLYEQWLYIEVIKGSVKADGLIEKWGNLEHYAFTGAWIQSDWSGSVKLNADFVKEVQGWKLAIEEGLATHEMASKALFGRKHNLIITQLRHENAKVAEAFEALGDFSKKRQPVTIDQEPNDTGDGNTGTDEQNKKEDDE